MNRVHLSLVTLAAILCLSVSAYAGTADTPGTDGSRDARQNRARLATSGIDTTSMIEDGIAPHFDYYFTEVEPEGEGEWREMVVRVRGEGQLKAQLTLKGDTPVPGLVREHTTYSRVLNFNRAGEEQEIKISFFLPDTWQWDLSIDEIE